MMSEIIKWFRLKEICEAILITMTKQKLVVNIHNSTDVPSDMLAAVSREGERVDIALNALFNKQLEDVVENIAHELVHIIDNDPEHDDEFAKKTKVIQRRITREYNR
jgi:hypothetical protein